MPLGVDVILQEVTRDHIFQILKKSRLLSQNSKAEKVKKVSRSLLPIVAPVHNMDKLLQFQGIGRLIIYKDDQFREKSDIFLLFLYSHPKTHEFFS